MKTPLVSIILPVYNCEQFVEEAIQSVLRQTFADFELIIINDGSTDNSLKKIKAIKDNRIILIDQTNIGLPATLNKGILGSKGKYIARQDQDDISYPERLQLQIDLLETFPSVGMVGCWADIVDMNGAIKGCHRHPARNEQLKFALIGNSPFVHSSIMFRREVFDSVGLYTIDPKRQPPEDYELFSRISRTWEIANIPKVMHIYREVSGSMSRVSENPFLKKQLTIVEENIRFYLPLISTAEISDIAMFLNVNSGLFSFKKIVRIFLNLIKCAKVISPKFGFQFSVGMNIAKKGLKLLVKRIIHY